MGAEYGPSIVTDGLVLYLDAGNTKSYPGTGSNWYDLSGLRNHFTLTGGYSFLGGVIVFDGINGYAYTTTNFVNDGIIGTGNISYSMESWVLISSTPGATTSGYSIIGNADATGIGLQFMNDGANKVNFGYRSNNNFYSEGPDISLDTWYHITATKIGNGNSFIYINGTLSSTFTDTTYLDIDATSSQMQIGYAASRILGRYDGKVGAVRLYNKTLDNAEVLQNFIASKRRFGL